MDGSNWIVVGRIAGPFGVRGEAKVEPYTDDPDRFAALDAVYLGPDHAQYGVERSRKHKNVVVLKLEEIDSPEAVRALGSPDITIPREQALPLPEGSYFLEEIIGVSVTTGRGQVVGEVTDVLRTGSNDVFVVGHGQSAVLIPVIRDAILELNLETRQVIVDEWILEPYL